MKPTPQQRALGKMKRQLLAVLRETTIAHVEIKYDGESDMGQIQQVWALDAKRSPLALSLLCEINVPSLKGKSTCSLSEALDDFAWEVLRIYHDGFEDGDGGWGRIIIDVVKGTVELDHNDRVIEFVNTTTEV